MSKAARRPVVGPDPPHVARREAGKNAWHPWRPPGRHPGRPLPSEARREKCLDPCGPLADGRPTPCYIPTVTNRTEIDWEALTAAAREVRERAHAPYSRFRVGAALLAEDGRIYAGCNVENRSFGLTICAERTAVARMVAAGARRPRALVVITDTSPPAPPCGMCRETLTEFAAVRTEDGTDRGLPILLVNLRGERREVTLAELFPDPFEWPTGLEPPA